MRDPIPDHMYVIAAILLQWFSLNDCMDGMRARRTKCGSPLGRIIDEAIDQLAYACISCITGYLIRVEPGIWLFSIGLVNVPFYAMEIRHYYFKDFVMIVGELGPVEVELIYTIIFLLTGLYIGGDGYDKTLAQVTGYEYEFLAIKTKYLVAGLTILLEIMFSYDNIKESLEKNQKETMKLMTPVFIIIGISLLHSNLPSIKSETVIVYFLYQMVFAIIILKLMIFNMSGKKFPLMFNVQFIYLLLPLIAYYIFCVSDQLEIMITRSCMVLALFEFLFSIFRIAKQYTEYHNINFFTIKDRKD
jgi:phosphatidylglycerophosphate synthase